MKTLYETYSQQPVSIAVFRALKLGDLLCSVPFFRALKTSFAKSSVTLISLPWADEFQKRFSRYIDSFEVFPGFPGLPEQEYTPQSALDFISRMSTRRYDILIQLHGSGSIINPLLEITAPGQFAGYFQPAVYTPKSPFVFPYPDSGPEVLRHMQLLQFLGIPQTGISIDFPLSYKDLSETETIYPSFSKRRYVIFHPGSANPLNRWPVQNFASVARLIHSLGFEVVVTGTQNEASLADQFKKKFPFPFTDLTAKTSLGSLGVLLKNASLLLANDTGVSHIASAFGTPSVILAVEENISRWSPLDTHKHTVIPMHGRNTLKRVNEAVVSTLQISTQKGTHTRQKPLYQGGFA